MSDKSGIEWTDATWNPVRGCSRVSPGCMNCYAETFTHRFSGPDQPYEGLTVLTANGPRWSGIMKEVPEMLDQPIRWKRSRLIFVNSMSDLFHEKLSFEYIAACFGIMAATPRHTYQILTKRPNRINEFMYWMLGDDDQIGFAIKMAEKYLPEKSKKAWLKEISNKSKDDITWPLKNVWMGTSVEDAKRKSRIEELKDVPTSRLFLSIEPLLEDLGKLDLFGIKWVIVGGESGHRARRMDPQWARNIRDQCIEQNVRFFFKQFGEYNEYGEKVGKKKAGRVLDGRLWDEIPDY